MVAPTRPDRLHLRFIADRKGSVAALFGVLAVPLAVATGMAVDYSRSASLRDTLQKAADAASISALRSAEKSFGQRKRIARDAVAANVDAKKLGLTRFEVRLALTTGGNVVEVRAAQPSLFGAFVGGRTRPVLVQSEAVTGSSLAEQYEVALVLDTTFSMRNDMNALRQAANEFVDLTASTGTRVSIVPYVAAVNPGFGIESPYLDRLGASPHHAMWLRYVEFAYHTSCTIPPDSFSAGGTISDPGTGGREGMRRPIGPTHIFGSVLRELLGISSAQAQTPNTVPPLSYTDHPIPPAGGAPAGSVAAVPNGFTFRSPCWVANPSRISHYDLHKRVRANTFKGCVEARPEPYDVTDTPPDPLNVNTLFVPYFWHDEISHFGEPFTNNYMNDGPVPPGWSFINNWYKAVNIMKYDGNNVADIQEVGPYTKGPNKACPDPIMRLSSDSAVLKSKIASLRHWAGGGTISSEGLTWGWRTLSPNLPFRDGAPYGSKKKAIVLMSDGKNEVNQPPNLPGAPYISDYTAYGFLGYQQRFPGWGFASAHSYLDQRFATACSNAKAAGIEIYVVAFRVSDEAASGHLRNCASSHEKFVAANNHAALVDAFQAFGSQLAGSGIRLAQ
jgi:Flp pilus assembly protein TadG